MAKRNDDFVTKYPAERLALAWVQQNIDHHVPYTQRLMKWNNSNAGYTA